MRKFFRDLDAAMERDPAARSRASVALTYPGFRALCLYRIAHRLWKSGLKLFAGYLSYRARIKYDVDIHPAAEIGEGLFIDHGSGTVIGETAEIGRNVTVYQGVTLGGNGKEKGKRHPTVGDGVVIYAGAKVLGAVKIGEYAVIGAGSVVLTDVPPHATVVGVPGRIIKIKGLAPYR